MLAVTPEKRSLFSCAKDIQHALSALRNSVLEVPSAPESIYPTSLQLVIRRDKESINGDFALKWSGQESEETASRAECYTHLMCRLMSIKPTQKIKIVFPNDWGLFNSISAGVLTAQFARGCLTEGAKPSSCLSPAQKRLIAALRAGHKEAVNALHDDLLKIKKVLEDLRNLEQVIRKLFPSKILEPNCFDVSLLTSATMFQDESRDPQNGKHPLKFVIPNWLGQYFSRLDKASLYPEDLVPLFNAINLHSYC